MIDIGSSNSRPYVAWMPDYISLADYIAVDKLSQHNGNTISSTLPYLARIRGAAGG